MLLAQVAPSRVTSGVYQVIVGEGAARFTIATESLTCSRIGDAATCAAPVAGRQLTVDITYRDPDAPRQNSTCTARHGDRPVPCLSTLGNYGHASDSVVISDQLGVTEPELTRLRDAVPWWRTANGTQNGALALLCVLALVAGVTTYLVNGRTRPREIEWRFPIAVGTGFLGLALYVVGSLVLARGENNVLWLLVAPGFPVLFSFPMLMAWQYSTDG